MGITWGIPSPAKQPRAYASFYNPLLILIAIFVYLAAEAEGRSSELQAISGGVVVGDVMVTEFAVLDTAARVDEAVEMLLATSQNEFPVVDRGGQFEGLLTRDGIIRAMKENGPETPVRTVMRKDVPTIDEGTPVDESLRIMQSGNAPAAAVIDRDRRLVGMMNYETIGEMPMLLAAVEDFRFASLRRYQSRLH